MATVNKKIWPDDTSLSTDNFTFTKTVADIPINTGIDKTITYATGYGQYADPETEVLGTWFKTNQPKIGMHNPWYTTTYRNIAIQASFAGGYYSFGNSNESNTAKYGFRSAFTADELPPYAEYQRFISGFKYYSIVGTIWVAYRNGTSDSSSTCRLCDLDTYYANHANEDIISVFMILYNGTATKRTSTNYQFVDVNTVPVLTSVIGTPNQYDKPDPSGPYVPRDNDTIIEELFMNSESILDLYPHGGTYKGYTLFGIETFSQGGEFGGSYENGDSFSTVNVFKHFHTANLADWNDFKNLAPNATRASCWYPGTSISRETILHLAATCGVIFTTSSDVGKNLDLSVPENILSEDLYFPRKGASGYWEGAYSHGADNANAEQVKDDWNSDKNRPFDNGSKPPEDEDVKFGNDGNALVTMPTSPMTNTYLLDLRDMRSLSTYLNNIDADLLDAIVQYMSMSAANPIDCIVSIMYSPIKLSGYGSVKTNVVVGGNLIDTSGGQHVPLKGVAINKTNFSIYLGKATIKPYFNNFLDFAPYTNIVCYIPFCGFVDLDPNYCMDKELEFIMFCDVVSGSCEVQIRVGGRVYKTIGGTFATPCNVVGTNNSAYINGAVSSAVKTVGGLGSIVTAGATGNVLLGVGGAGAILSGAYDFAINKKELINNGKLVGNLGQMSSWDVCIYTYRVEDLADDSYGSYIGYACEESHKLSEMVGWTVCENAVVNFAGPTDREREIIRSTLESGVFC